ncbi:HpcH/HpaI aldolase family protein [Youngiibacter multivorans]|uniref:2-keto-3-deoxy-L-rhamnonate aldolase RhmA n=1 Tax=Youngiibacter multivorans TaxID=937251 RepID=A0ABS4G992_9CLOT|nr:aldolase/citrate lyase family protein [Youngiibacter multivorans]MBP1920987.1 2-keto-3-deoxy-L-rhamnonate aldolase RhmA [Youngiibacter multivorans]
MGNEFLRKVKSDKKPLGTLSAMESTTALECLGYTGIDYVMLDTEHGPLSEESASKYMLACKASGLSTLVRVKEISRSPVLKVLDSGADGIIVPGIENIEQVMQLVGFAKFPPVGNRGFCPTRDGGWGFSENSLSLDSYMDYCNRETILIPQCETKGCLESIEDIVSIEGVDGILVGPYDLSIDMGKPGQFEDTDVKGAIERILRACKASGKISMIFSGDALSAKKYLDAGFDSVVVGIDTSIYIRAYREIVSQIIADTGII